MRVNFEVDTSDVDHELDRLGRGPTAQDLLRLNAVLAEQFALTQGYVHVITGSLRTSGRFHGDMSDERWNGEISYGGDAPGAVHPFVKYANYEQSRNDSGVGFSYPHGLDREGTPGTDHNFMRPLLDDPRPQGYIDAIEGFYSDGND